MSPYPLPEGSIGTMPAYEKPYRMSQAAINQQNALRLEVGQAMADLGYRVCYSDELPWEPASAARSMLGYYDERGKGAVTFAFRDIPYRVLNPAYEHLHTEDDFALPDIVPEPDFPKVKNWGLRKKKRARVDY